MYNKVVHWLDDNLERYVGMFFSASMVILLFLQVVSRYIFRYSLPWSEELALICFILSIYFGASQAVKRKQHLKIEILTNFLPPKIKKVFEILSNAVFFAFCVYITKGLLAITSMLYRSHNKTAVTGIPKAYIYIFLPITMILMAFRLIQETVRTIREIRNLDKGEM